MHPVDPAGFAELDLLNLADRAKLNARTPSSKYRELMPRQERKFSVDAKQVSKICAGDL
jgi:hypothetical protein